MKFQDETTALNCQNSAFLMAHKPFTEETIRVIAAELVVDLNDLM